MHLSNFFSLSFLLSLSLLSVYSYFFLFRSPYFFSIFVFVNFIILKNSSQMNCVVSAQWMCLTTPSPRILQSSTTAPQFTSVSQPLQCRDEDPDPLIFSLPDPDPIPFSLDPHPILFLLDPDPILVAMDSDPTCHNWNINYFHFGTKYKPESTNSKVKWWVKKSNFMPTYLIHKYLHFHFEFRSYMEPYSIFFSIWAGFGSVEYNFGSSSLRKEYTTSTNAI